jgi:hypothetical protein
MNLQEPKKKTRVPIQFYVEIADKERADRVADHFGDIAHMARTGFLEQVANRERQTEKNKKLAS